MMVDLFYNLSTLVAFVIFSGYLNRARTSPLAMQFFQGLLFACATLVVMVKPLVLSPGVVFDGRSIMISLGALFYGPLTGTMAALAASAWRLHIGGGGAVVGLLVIWTACVLGVLFHYMDTRFPLRRVVSHLLLGILVHVSMVLYMFLLPDGGKVFFQSLALPVITLYPVLFTLMALIKDRDNEYLRNNLATRKNEEKFRAVFGATSDAMLIFEAATGRLLEVNQRALDMWGAGSREEVNDWFRLPTNFDPGPWSLSQVKRHFNRARKGSHERFEWQARRADGEHFWAEIAMGPAQASSGKLVICTIRDISARKRRQEDLDKEYRLFSTLMEHLNIGILMVDPQGAPLVNNEAALAILGSGSIYHGDHVCLESETGAAYPEARHPLWLALRGQTSHVDDMVIRNSAGKETPVEMHGTPIHDDDGHVWAGLVSFMDISARKAAADRIQVALEQKEALFTELYHRTKNNMQVIISILSLQSARMRDDSVKQVFKDTVGRIYSMSLVHNMLYRSQNLSRLRLDDYIRELAPLILGNWPDTRDRISLDLDLGQVAVSIDEVMPCGLILNELITNSLKYAFPRKAKGSISIQLLRREGCMLQIIYQDSGPGIPEFPGWENLGSLGLNLVRTLAEQQLHGSCSFTFHEGFMFSMDFVSRD